VAALLRQCNNDETIFGYGSRGPYILLGNIVLSEVDMWPGQCMFGLVVKGYLPLIDSYPGATSLIDLSGGRHRQITDTSSNVQRLSVMSRLYLNVQWVER